MALNCGENPLLKAVQDSKNALKEKMAALKGAATDAVAGALEEIKQAKAKLKKDLLAAVPEIPKLPDFQKELDELINAGLSLSAASKFLAKKTNLPKSKIYKLH